MAYSNAKTKTATIEKADVTEEVASASSSIMPKKKIPLDEAVLMSGIGRTTFYKFMKSERA